MYVEELDIELLFQEAKLGYLYAVHLKEQKGVSDTNCCEIH
jgi:hypothetical protein